MEFVSARQSLKVGISINKRFIRARSVSDLATK